METLLSLVAVASFLGVEYFSQHLGTRLVVAVESVMAEATTPEDAPPERRRKVTVSNGE